MQCFHFYFTVANLKKQLCTREKKLVRLASFTSIASARMHRMHRIADCTSLTQEIQILRKLENTNPQLRPADCQCQLFQQKLYKGEVPKFLDEKRKPPDRAPSKSCPRKTLHLHMTHGNFSVSCRTAMIWPRVWQKAMACNANCHNTRPETGLAEETPD